MPTVYCYIRESHLFCAHRGGNPISPNAPSPNNHDHFRQFGGVR